MVTFSRIVANKKEFLLLAAGISEKQDFLKKQTTKQTITLSHDEKHPATDLYKGTISYKVNIEIIIYNP